MKIGIVSGYFNPIHSGHLQYLNAAKNESDRLIVIVNNDNQIKLKKSTIFMDENHRLDIINNIKAASLGILSIDQDLTVQHTLACIISKFKEKIPHCTFTFYNSGDRHPKNIDTIEEQQCYKLGINTKFLSLPKIYSSRNFR